MIEPILSQRALNRATLHRQLLLDRQAMPVLDAVRRLVALNAQDPNPPYLTLWARLTGFIPDQLTRLLYDKRVVRSSLLRATQHLATAEDYRWIRPLLQGTLVRAWRGAFGRVMNSLDPDDVAATARTLLTGRTLTRPQLRDLLIERFPGADPMAISWSVQALLAIVHPPPSGTWNTHGATPFALAEDWLGEPMDAEPDAAEMIRRYLAAFGPATVMDMQAWSGLTRLREVVDRIRPELCTFRNETGGELFDLSDAPLPDPDTPAPVRYLPAFDNLMLAQADRTRVMSDEQRKRVCVGAAVEATVLVDGRVAAVWSVTTGGGAATLTIDPLSRLSAGDRAAIEEEGSRLLAFTHPDKPHSPIIIDDR